MQLINIRGPRGAFNVCAITGQIVTPVLDVPAEYRIYQAADVTELQQWHSQSGADIRHGVPILCVGMIRRDGSLSAAEEVFREEWLYTENYQPMAA